MKKLYSSFFFCMAMLWATQTQVKAQFGSDLGPTSVSSLAWDHIVSHTHGTSNSITIGMTTDGRIYTWGENFLYTIKSTMSNSSPSQPVMQTTPNYVPFPTGETAKKIGMTVSLIGSSGFYKNTFFALTQSGKVYAWGLSPGLPGSWPVKANYTLPADWADTTSAKRIPQALTMIPGENSIVDMAASPQTGYGFVGASGKAYSAKVDVSTGQLAYVALPNPAGVDAATFKYIRIWGGIGTIYLKGNNGSIYYTGTHAKVYNSGVPTIFGIFYGTTLTPAEEAGDIFTLTPHLVAFPVGEDIVDMKISANSAVPTATNYAFSASGKAYLAGQWRATQPGGTGLWVNYTLTPLKAALSSSIEEKVFLPSTGDSIYCAKQFVEIAMPPGASKILDIANPVASGRNSISVVIGDNNKAYWSGTPYQYQYFSPFVGNYIMYSDAITSPYLCNKIEQVTSNTFYAWEKESINFHGAAKFFEAESPTGAASTNMFIVSKTGRGYYIGTHLPSAGLGKIFPISGFCWYPTPIANEQLLDCQTSPGTGGPLTAGPVVPTNTAVGSIDCAKTQLAPAPVAGTPSQTTLIVSINVTTAGTFTPLTVSGSGMSLGNGVATVSTTTTGIQTFYIPLQYDGTALSPSFQFTVGSAGSCTADLTQQPTQKITNVWSLNNCAAIVPGTLSK